MPAMMQNDAVASLYKSLGIGGRKPRTTASAKRREIAMAQVATLEKVLADIRRKARETPTWATAYFSAATTIEIEIAAIKAESNL